MEMHTIVVLLGGNRGNVLQTFERVCNALALHIGTITAKSSVFESEAWGFADSQLFLNQVVTMHTSYIPIECLQICLGIESECCSVRSFSKGYESRIIEIDILYYDSCIVNTENLTIPHPHIQQRKFALLPLVELLPDFIHPILRKTNSELLTACTDSSQVQKYVL